MSMNNTQVCSGWLTAAFEKSLSNAGISAQVTRKLSHAALCRVRGNMWHWSPAERRVL